MPELLLATYLPFNRVHEVAKYFNRSVEAVDPDETLVFVDNVVDGWQMDVLRDKVEHRTVGGKWGGRVLTWISILEEFLGRDCVMLVVDSDNVMDAGSGKFVRGFGDKLLTFMDWDDWKNGSKGILPRSSAVGEVTIGGVARPLYEYPVYNGSLFQSGPSFFVGPKQAVLLAAKPDIQIFYKLKNILTSLPRDLVRHLTDETFLGVLAYLMGFKKVAWTVGSTHYRSSSSEDMDPTQLTLMRAVNALAHERFAAALYREFGLEEFRRYREKYVLARIKNAFSGAL
ncbi:hypothetical protein [Conexivisphaera calida]|uniref:Glycosyltransferase n=1 Tax=Conexivisphaera calida TaxID=1874277 RepID=A0A4P2VH45_9ARCH|nr:hypothetical protein [Conexivisphaera calida]BBE42753.1 hypothetical protein NAS2_1366 [Conexivisphaera calida]